MPLHQFFDIFDCDADIMSTNNSIKRPVIVFFQIYYFDIRFSLLVSTR